MNRPLKSLLVLLLPLLAACSSSGPQYSNQACQAALIDHDVSKALTFSDAHAINLHEVMEGDPRVVELAVFVVQSNCEPFRI